MIKIPFMKLSGAGNDFVIIDNRQNIVPYENTDFVTKVCERRMSVGADGVLLVENSDQAVHFVDKQNGWAAGEEGKIIHTRNGGIRWIEQQSNTEEPLLGIYFNDAQNGWVVGVKGLILHTADGGETWERQESQTKKTLRGVAEGARCEVFRRSPAPEDQSRLSKIRVDAAEMPCFRRPSDAGRGCAIETRKRHLARRA